MQQRGEAVSKAIQDNKLDFLFLCVCVCVCVFSLSPTSIVSATVFLLLVLVTGVSCVISGELMPTTARTYEVGDRLSIASVPLACS